jgi:predicted nucleic acid-binding protein
VILVDTNVVLDALNGDPKWGPWSKAQLVSISGYDDLAINDVVFAELSVGYEDFRYLEAMVAEWRLQLRSTPRLALFYAGKAYQQYRRSSGTKTGVLPDFFIGAHAAVEGWPLLTRDPTRVRSYFPTVTLIAP